MLADTDAIRALGLACRSHAADLAAVAATLSAVPSTGAVDTFGPVGARFLAALSAAIAEQSRAVATLAERVTAGSATADGSATAYDDAEGRTATRLQV
ncbi:hypothetical protein [Mycobacterium hubeiense]|uniref:hypothetical protein n=1 Tax=Mycobacterium hubeiense TaxID=1867256 RepID=UPI000C7E9647|nr:hypothetical protein [Mycobacterium sp. QGD 101]